MVKPKVFFCTALLACSSALAAWQYDAGAERISDGNWDFGVSVSGDELTVTNYFAGAGDLDFTSLPADTGKRMIAFGNCPNQWGRPGVFYFKNVNLTSVTAPDIKVVGQWTFCFYSSITNLVFGEALQSIESQGCRDLTKLQHFEPSVLPNLTTIGQGAFQGMGSATDPALLESIDLELPALTELPVQLSFSNASIVRSFTAANLTKVMGSDHFLNNAGLRRASLPKLATFVNALRFFKGCTALEEVDLGTTITTLPGDMFNGCTALSLLTLRAPIASVAAGALKDLAPSARVIFYGEAPTFAADSISAVGAEENDCRLKVIPRAGRTSASWQKLVAPQAAKFETYKAKPDYPGDLAFGLIDDGTACSWVMDYDYALLVTTTIDDRTGDTTPAMGPHFDLTDGATVPFSASADEFEVSDVLHGKIAGWKLYTVAADGTRTEIDSDKTLSGSFVYHAGTRYCLEWQADRLHLVTIAGAEGGTVDDETRFVAESEDFVLTATPDGGKSFGMWKGVPAAVCAANPLRMKVTKAMTVTPYFNGKWSYDRDAKTITDGNWTLNVTEPTSGNLAITCTMAGSSGSGILALTSFPEDVPGYHVTELTACQRYQSPFSAETTGGHLTINAFVAPEVTSVGTYTFCQAGAMLECIVLSDNLASVGAYTFWATGGVTRFHPARMPALASVGVRAFCSCGNGTSAELEPIDFDLPSLTQITVNEVFNSAPIVRSIRADALTTVTGTDVFSNSKNLRRIVLPKLATVTGGSLCKGSLALGEAEIGGTLTTLPANAFSGCTALSNVVIKAPVSTVAAGALKNIAPFAKVVFTGDAPAFESDSLSATDAEAKDCRVSVCAVTASSSPTWAAAVAPQAETFEAYKTKPDYPGADAFGLFYDGTAYSWAVRYDYSLQITAAAGEYGTVSPDYGFHFGYADGETIPFSAPAGDFDQTDLVRVHYVGWTLYTVAADGSLTEVGSDDTLSGSFTYRSGKCYRLVWKTANKHKVTVTPAAGGTIDGGTQYVEEGEDLVLAATPDAGNGFGAWLGVPAAFCAMNPLRMPVTKSMSLTPYFNGKWSYDDEAKTITDGNWTLNVTEDASGNLTITTTVEGTAGSGILALTSFPTDVPGHHVTAFGTSYRNNSLFSSENKAGYHVLAAVVAPEVTSIGDWFFYMPGTQFELAAFSADMTYIGGWAFWNANGVTRFFPGRMEKLTKFGNNRPFNNLGGAVAEGLEPVDFVMPALKSVTPEAFATSKMVASVTATGVTSVAAQAFDACPSLTNVVFGKVLTSLGDYALRKLPGGATVHLPGRHAPTLGAGAIYSENASNRARILIRRNYPGSGWDDLLTPLTEEDLAREDYPGEMTLGTVQAAGTAYSAWLVETKPRTGLLLMVR